MYARPIFELSTVLDSEKFQKIFDRALIKSDYFEKDGNEYVDNSISGSGVTVLYRNSQYKKKVRIIINPEAFFAAEEEDDIDIQRFGHKLNYIIRNYFSNKCKLNDFLVTGMTLTLDMDVGSRDMVHSYIDVLQRIGKVKLYTPLRYRIEYQGLDRNNSFCLNGNSNGIMFFIYDDSERFKNYFRGEPWVTERDPENDIGGNILSTQIILTTMNAIRQYTCEIAPINRILDLYSKRDEIFMDIFSQIIPNGDFYKKNDADKIVVSKVNNPAMQRHMLELIDLIPKKKSLLLAQKAMNYRDVEKIMNAFTEIGLSPVTISKRSNVRVLPSLYSYMN